MPVAQIKYSSVQYSDMTFGDEWASP